MILDLGDLEWGVDEILLLCRVLMLGAEPLKPMY